MATKIPRYVCVLDLETQKTDFKSPEECDLAVVGVKVYLLRGKEYHPHEYKYYLPDQLKELEHFLHEFGGLIIGHNILGFDYRVLRPHLSLEGIVEKTVDTLAFLYLKNGSRLMGLSLENLAQINLRKGKTGNGKAIPELWRQGNYEEVIAYNENDCTLTMELWWLMLKQRFLHLDKQFDNINAISILTKDVAHLKGKTPQFTFATWEEKLKNDGYIIIPQYQRRGRTWENWESDQDYLGEPEIEIEARFYWFYCDHCQITFLLQARIQPGFADFEQVNCPSCKKSFGEIRADLGYTLVGQRQGDFGTGSSQGSVPAPFWEMVIKNLQTTRREWRQWWLPPDSQIRFSAEITGQCTICGRILSNGIMNEDQAYKNPVDESPICVECFTAARWLLTLK